MSVAKMVAAINMMGNELVRGLNRVPIIPNRARGPIHSGK